MSYDRTSKQTEITTLIDDLTSQTFIEINNPFKVNLLSARTATRAENVGDFI